MQQCRMIALKSMLAERTHVFFHTLQCMRKNRVCGQQEIIDVHLENKLCKLGASLHNQGQNMLWPGHQGCTATVYFLQKSASMFSASVAMSQTTIENCIGGHVNVLSVYGKT